MRQPRGLAVVENTVDIRSSPEEVFDYCVDLTREPEWNPNARRVEKVSGPTGLGTRYEAEFLKGNPRPSIWCASNARLPGTPWVALAAWTPEVKAGPRR
jgi:hypothetical protein